MLKKLFVAIAIVIASPLLVSAEDVFWSFSQTAVETIWDGPSQGESGSVYIFSDGLFGFDALDLVFSSNNASVLRFTGGEVFNPTFNVIGGERFHEPVFSIDSGDRSGRLFLANLGQNGVNPALSSYDPGFDSGVGPNGAVLLARVDFQIINGGDTGLEFALGQLGAIVLPSTDLNPTFGSAVVTGVGVVRFPDLFWSLSPTVFQPTFPSGSPDQLGSAYLFANGSFGFDAADINFRSSDSNVMRLTGGEAFNPTFDTLGGTMFDESNLTIDASGDGGNLFSVNVTQNGINPAVSPLFNPSYAPGVGPDGAVLLARVDFEIVGDGVANLDLSLGRQGILQLPDLLIEPTFGSAAFGCDSATNLGDVGLDGSVDALDVAPFILVLASYGYQLQADCNEDCLVNFLDIAPFIQILSSQ